ncbi:hypothetical protein [Rhizobacter sp. Root1221]|uniref:hypothetical protein n=1 Tax=Rhizobacter sp. Root1221 TaxID=1736433 RepID=UPI000700DDD2|nr:hypothetical protein [Rhizobacter sp. Root1221]KQW00165.1 hypothetical protein ASC87_19335 [Rhizobacter sp. Root1221]
MEENASPTVRWTDEWWRWPLVPVAAVAGLFAAWIAASAVLWLQMKFTGGFAEDGWYFRFIVPALASAAAGYGYSMAACMTAPRGHKFAGTAMVTLLAVVGLLSTTIAWTSTNYSVGLAIQTTVAAVVTQAAAIAALVAFET